MRPHSILAVVLIYALLAVAGCSMFHHAPALGPGESRESSQQNHVQAKADTLLIPGVLLLVGGVILASAFPAIHYSKAVFAAGALLIVASLYLPAIVPLVHESVWLVRIAGIAIVLLGLALAWKRRKQIESSINILKPKGAA